MAYGSSKVRTFDTLKRKAQKIEISGTLPTGVKVKYEGNGKINAGKYKVTFNNDGVTEVVEVEESHTVTKPVDPTKSGYTFEGWYHRRDGGLLLINFQRASSRGYF